MNKNTLLRFISEQGYKNDSPDKNNPINVIPSNRITMKGVDHPVHGVDNLGNEKMMYPGEEHKFPGQYVVETPVKEGFHKMPNGTIMADDKMPSNEELKIDKKYKQGGLVHNVALAAYNIKNFLPLKN